MRIARHRFLAGPNLQDDESGLLLALEPDLPAMPERPAPERCARIFATLGLPRLGQRWTAEDRPDTTEMLCRVAVALLMPVSIVPPVARLIGAAPASRVFLRCEHEAAGLAAWACAGAALRACRPGGDLAAFEAVHAEFLWWARALHLDITARVFAQEARRLGIPWFRLRVPGPFVQIGQGVHRRYLYNATADSTGVISRLMSQDKALTGELLAGAGIPVLPSQEVWDERQAVAAAERLGYPVVVKPCRGGGGRGVSVHLTDPAAVAAAFHRAAVGGDSVLVEKYAAGDDHRVLVLCGKVVAASRRVPPQVEGDGRRSVAALVEALNADPRRAPGHEGLLTRLEVDGEVRALLAEQGLGLDSVPEAGRRVPLRRIANLSQGGIAFDALPAMHPENRALLERTAAVLELGLVGIDFMIADIARPWREAGGVVLELNATPGLRPHWVADPDSGVDERIMRALLPPGSDGRIPTCAITGADGASETAGLVARILDGMGLAVGSCTAEGAAIGAERRQDGDCADGRHARALLLDPAVEAGVFALAPGALRREGMVIEDCEVGAVLGTAGRADLARLCAIVARRRGARWCSTPRTRSAWRCARARRPGSLAGGARRRGAGAGRPSRRRRRRHVPRRWHRPASPPRAAPATAPSPPCRTSRPAGGWRSLLFAAAIAHAMGAPIERIRAGLASEAAPATA
ncbi:MAG: hypothetical protein U1E53_22625 [Dongiaceae bacterium]